MQPATVGLILGLIGLALTVTGTLGLIPYGPGAGIVVIAIGAVVVIASVWLTASRPKAK